jgi:hypothetical protein
MSIEDWPKQEVTRDHSLPEAPEDFGSVGNPENEHALDFEEIKLYEQFEPSGDPIQDVQLYRAIIDRNKATAPSHLPPTRELALDWFEKGLQLELPDPGSNVQGEDWPGKEQELQHVRDVRTAASNAMRRVLDFYGKSFQ